MKDRKVLGFTIIELLIVIVVIGILSTLALNSFANAQQQARNAQTITIAKAYHKAILGYVAVNSEYPPDYACFGTGYPDINNDSTAGDCEGNTTNAYVRESTAFNNAIKPYVGSVDTKTNPTIIAASWGARSVGAFFYYSTATTLNGQPQHRWLVYSLEGTDEKCPVGPIVAMGTWPAFVSGSHNGTTENWWQNGVRCWIPLAQNV